VSIPCIKEIPRIIIIIIIIIIINVAIDGAFSGHRTSKGSNPTA